MKYMPLFFNLMNKKVLIVGGGKVALKRAKQFEAACAHITVISEQIHHELKGLNKIELIERKVSLSDITNKFFLVLVATNDKVANELITNECHKKNIPCNRADNHYHSSFINGSIIDKEPVNVAVISGGVPEVSKYIQNTIQNVLSVEIIELASILCELRDVIKEKKGNNTRDFIKRWVTKEIIDRIANEGKESIKQEIIACL